MEPKIIGVRELHRNLKKIALATKRGTSFLVMVHSTPLFRIEPIKKETKKYGLKDFAQMTFSDPDKNLSKKVDEIVYDL